MNVFELESSHIAIGIDVARRGPDHDMSGYAIWGKTVGQRSDHRTHRMTDNDHGAVPKVINDFI